LPGEGVGQVQSAETPTISQSVMDEVHGPTLPRSSGRSDLAAFLTLEPLLALLAQCQLLFTIQTMQLLMINDIASEAQSTMQQAITPSRLLLG
jgi:hypothetical protein